MLKQVNYLLPNLAQNPESSLIRSLYMNNDEDYGYVWPSLVSYDSLSCLWPPPPPPPLLTRVFTPAAEEKSLLPHCNHLACLSSALVVPGRKRKRLILKYQSNALTTTQNTPSTTKHKIKTTEYNRNWIVKSLDNHSQHTTAFWRWVVQV